MGTVLYCLIKFDIDQCDAVRVMEFNPLNACLEVDINMDVFSWGLKKDIAELF